MSADIGCHLFATGAPFDLGATTMGYGLGAAGAAAFSGDGSGNRPVSIMGDGGFWHNGLTSGVGNAVFNHSDQVMVVVDNDYAAATGGAAGSEPADLLSVRIYLIDVPGYQARGREIGAVWKELCGRTYPAMTGVGVTALWQPEALIEIEAVARCVPGS